MGGRTYPTASELQPPMFKSYGCQGRLHPPPHFSSLGTGTMGKHDQEPSLPYVESYIYTLPLLRAINHIIGVDDG